jgi:hypothetical protein
MLAYTSKIDDSKTLLKREVVWGLVMDVLCAETFCRQLVNILEAGLSSERCPRRPGSLLPAVPFSNRHVIVSVRYRNTKKNCVLPHIRFYTSAFILVIS